MDHLITFLDDLEVERQVPLFSVISYDYDKTEFIIDAIEEVKRRSNAGQVIGPDAATSRVLDNTTHIYLRLSGNDLTANIHHERNFRSARLTRSSVFPMNSSTLVSDLIAFVDSFMNVEIVQNT